MIIYRRFGGYCCL